VVVFLADNGGVDRLFEPPSGMAADGSTPVQQKFCNFSSAPLRAGKGSLYEGGVRVPCMIRWPEKLRPGRVVKTPIHMTDWMPTLFSFAAAAPPEDYRLDGVNLAPLLIEGEPLPERPIITYAPLYDARWLATPGATLRRGDWKLVEFFGDYFEPDGQYRKGRKVELYNLRDDLGETRDLAAEHPERVDAMLKELHAGITEMGAPIPGPNPEFNPAKALLEEEFNWREALRADPDKK
jgi:uncharacterized sulfatase